MLWLINLCALLLASSVALASESMVHRRVLEGQKGWQDVIRLVKAYEIHDFANHAPTRRALQSAGDKFLTYDLHVLGRRMTLELERHDTLFAKGYKHYILDKNGEPMYTEDAPDCLYKGKVTGEKNTAALVSLCHDMVHATVYHHEDHEKSFSIQPLDPLQEETTDHVVYRHRDLLDPQRYCGVGRDETQLDSGGRLRRLSGQGHDHGHHDHHDQLHLHDDIYDRDYTVKVESRRDLLSSKKIIGVSVVNDKVRFEQRKKSVLSHSSYLFGLANGLYAKIGDVVPSTFTYELEIVSMYTFANGDPWTYSPVPSITPTPVPTTTVRMVGGEVSSEDLLTAFEAWRVSSNGIKPAQGIAAVNGADLAHLLTGYTFVGSTIGLAHLNGVCRTSARSGETQTTDLTDSHQASTITHEIGHNLGAQHTDQPPPGFGSCQNNNAEQIMSSGSAYGFTNWEACTVQYFKDQFTTKYGSGSYSLCAETASSTTFDGTPRCGDGLVQSPEQCDCINQDCTGVDPCCNGATCQLNVGANCSALDGCCTNSCSIRSDTNFVCRAASTGCDIEEKCDGVSGKCPFDTFKPTGEACTTSPNSLPGTCYNKKCLDAKQECITRGTQNGPSDQWVNTCSNEDASEGANDCIVSCTTNPSGATNCQKYVATVYYADGTQCQTGKGCYQGVCTAFAQIPVASNPLCENEIVDQNETDVDCGGGNCFGCAAGKLCFKDTDCLFPSNCNKTTTVNANGYVGLGRCSASQKSGQLEDTLNQILSWFRANPQIWGPIAGALALFLLICCCWPRSGGRPPIAKATYIQAQQSFRNVRGRPGEVPTAVAVPVQNT